VLKKNRNTAQYLSIILAILLLGLAGCADKDQPTPDNTKTPSVEKNVSKPVIQGIVTVNGSPITQAELDYMRARTFGRLNIPVGSGGVEQKLLESMIASRAISQKSAQSIDQEKHKEIELMTAAYREELLVKEYIATHVTPEPVTREMAEQYYKDHPEEFGAGVEKIFELIRTVKVLKGEQRDELLQMLSQLEVEKNWALWAKRLQSLSVVYKKAKARAELLDQPLRQLVHETQPGQISPVQKGEHIFIIRVIGEKKLVPKPYSEVSAEIRKKLAPVKLKAAIKGLSQEIVKKAQVTYRKK